MSKSNTARFLADLHTYIFKYHDTKLRERLSVIREEHLALTNTPNFFFRGEPFIVDNSLPVVALATELKERTIAYIKSVRLLTKDKRVVSSYFSGLYKLPVQDIYYMLPTSIQSELDKPNNYKPDYIDQLLDGRETDAFKIIDKELLFKLIT